MSNSTTCTSCFSGLLLYNQTCIAQCPAKTFVDNLKCSDCAAECTNCTSLTVCQSCVAGKFLYGTQCLGVCPDSFYGDSADSLCKKCAPQCLKCTSPTYW